MSREGEFLVYCIEIYKKAKALTGKATITLFEQYRVPEYVRSYYEALHTTGEKYIIDDIDLYIKARQES